MMGHKERVFAPLVGPSLEALVAPDLTRPADVCRAGIVARHLAGVLLERVPEYRGNDDVVAVASEDPAQ
jgi:hypothetical protein